MTGFLLDENLPYRFQFKPTLPVIHSTDISNCPSDTVVWSYALNHCLVIVTKDSDFSDWILVATPPPWVVHLRIGNLRKNHFHSFIARIWPQIEALLPEHKLINVYLDKIEAVS